MPPKNILGELRRYNIGTYADVYGAAMKGGFIAFCKGCVAGYKVPKSVEFVDSLPKNPAGKILKKELRAKYWTDRGFGVKIDTI